MIKKVMKACAELLDPELITYPCYGLIKLDGFRCLAINGVAYTRTLKLIPNLYVQAYFKHHNLNGSDGELTIRGGHFGDAQSAFMSIKGEPDFDYNIFDTFEPNMQAFYSSRHDRAIEYVKCLRLDRVKLIPRVCLNTMPMLVEFYNNALEAGYEGICTRDPEGPYKQGRSTMKQGWLLKLKPKEDKEATIIGVTELQHNLDTATTKNENKVGGNTLGALIVRWEDKEFKVGSGFDEELRSKLYAQRKTLPGQIVTFAHQGLTHLGTPRFPVFIGLRKD